MPEGHSLTRAEGSGESGFLPEGKKNQKSRRQSAKKPQTGCALAHHNTPIFEENRGGDWGPAPKK